MVFYRASSCLQAVLLEQKCVAFELSLEFLPPEIYSISFHL